MSNLQMPTESSLVSAGVAQSDLSWFAIQTWPRYEKKVSAELQRKDVDVFLPLFSSKHQWSDRTRVVHSPLFPSYVFVRLKKVETANGRISVLGTEGVKSFVGVRGRGTPIPDTQIDAVRTIVAEGIPFYPHPYLNIGQRVRIRGGSLDGVQGILLAKHDDLSLIISVHFIQRALSIRVAGYTVEPA
jgi:transcription antitermination factor NusG